MTPEHSSLPQVEDDGLITPEIGPWAEQKYRLVSNYCEMFAKSMKARWDCRVYIDLFAGAGHSKFENTSRIVHASPLLALGIAEKFDRYILCEKDDTKCEALRKRVSLAYPEVDVSIIRGDVNEKVDEIIEKIPSPSRKHKVLCFCFADPYNLKNLRFQTIRRLSTIFVDFLVLIPTGMDADRNVSHYLRPQDHTVDGFLGAGGWRELWREAERRNEKFGSFLTEQFGAEMKNLKYIYSGIGSTVIIRSIPQNLPLYRLAFFSRHSLGKKFWIEARKYSKDQLELFQDL